MEVGRDGEGKPNYVLYRTNSQEALDVVVGGRKVQLTGLAALQEYEAANADAKPNPDEPIRTDPNDGLEAQLK